MTRSLGLIVAERLASRDRTRFQDSARSSRRRTELSDNKTSKTVTNEPTRPHRLKPHLRLPLDAGGDTIDELIWHINGYLDENNHLASFASEPWPETFVDRSNAFRDRLVHAKARIGETNALLNTIKDDAAQLQYDLSQYLALDPR